MELNEGNKVFHFFSWNGLGLDSRNKSEIYISGSYWELRVQGVLGQNAIDSRGSGVLLMFGTAEFWSCWAWKLELSLSSKTRKSKSSLSHFLSPSPFGLNLQVEWCVGPPYQAWFLLSFFFSFFVSVCFSDERTKKDPEASTF